MKIRMYLIKILIKSLWNSYYAVNPLRMGFDRVLYNFDEQGKKHPFRKGFRTSERLGDVQKR